MANNILTDFFYGNIKPNEKSFSRSSEYGNAADKLAGIESKLRGQLDESSMELLEQLASIQGTINGLTAEGYYIDGFRTGFQLAIALLDDGRGEQPFFHQVRQRR